MNFHDETTKTIKSRLDVLNKGLVSENNSVQYYKTLTEKTPEDTEENIGARRMYQELMEEEKIMLKNSGILLNAGNRSSGN